MPTLPETDHPSFAELDRYRLRDLVEAQARTVRSHLLTCGGCRHTVLNAAGLTALVRTLVAAGAVAEYIEPGPALVRRPMAPGSERRRRSGT
jgi:hypothetical protein